MSELVQSNEQSIIGRTTKEARHVETAVSTHITKEISTTEQTILNLVTATANETSRVVSHGITRIQADNLDQKGRERFLGSLKFVGMNKRRSHVTDSHVGTFKWIFDADPASDAINLISPAGSISASNDEPKSKPGPLDLSDSDTSSSSLSAPVSTPLQKNGTTGKLWDSFLE